MYKSDHYYVASDLDLEHFVHYFTIVSIGMKISVTVFLDTTRLISMGSIMDKWPMVPYRLSPFGGDRSTATLTLGQNAFSQYYYV